MSADRDAILNRIRSALEQSQLPQSSPVVPPRIPDVSTADLASLTESFSRELQAVGGEVYQPATLAAARAQVLHLIEATGTAKVLAWAKAALPLPGLGSLLASAGLQWVTGHLSSDPAVRRRQIADLDQPQVGVTGALAGLADTGSVVLSSGPGRGRAASLLPLVHVVVLSTRQLYPTLAAFLNAHRNLPQKSSNVVFITGPSRTADIEMIITRGVHGPKRLAVVLVPDP